MAEAEMTIKTEFNFEKRVEMFGDSVDNYTIPHELTVEITLAEYRRLLQAEAKAEANAANHDKWDREQEIRRLKVDALRAALRAKRKAEGPDDDEDQ